MRPRICLVCLSVMPRTTDHSPVTNTRPHALRRVVSTINRTIHAPVVLLVFMGSFFTAAAGAFGVAAWGSLGPDPEDYLTEYEAASLTALVGIQKLAIAAGVLTLLLIATVFYATAIVVTQLSDSQR